MQRLVLLALALVLVIGCQSHKEQAAGLDSVRFRQAVTLPLSRAALIARFLHKFRPIVKTSLIVYSNDDVNSDTFYYRGVALDSLERLLLPTDVQRWNQDSCYACYRW